MGNSSFQRIYFLHVNFIDFKFSQIIAFVFRLYTVVFHTFYAFYRFYPPFRTFCILLVKSHVVVFSKVNKIYIITFCLTKYIFYFLGHTRACSHKMNVRIFEHNFGKYKAKKCRRAVARQIFSTQ